jgi:hypothetical protein
MGEQIANPEPRKARLQHVCEWCNTPVIEKGEIHMAWVWVEDGSASTVRMHLDCYEAMDREREWPYDELICQDYHRRGMTHDESLAAREKEQDE